MKTLSRFVIKFPILIVGMLSCFDRADHLNDEGFVTRMGSTWPATEVGR